MIICLRLVTDRPYIKLDGRPGISVDAGSCSLSAICSAVMNKFDSLSMCLVFVNVTVFCS